MEFVNNPFLEYPIDICCGDILQRPFFDYIYFMDRTAYATNGYLLLGLSLSDIGAEDSFIEFVEGYKIHHNDLKSLNTNQRLFLDANGKIFINHGYTKVIRLLTIDHHDSTIQHQTLPGIIEKAIIEKSTHQDLITNISINFPYLQSIKSATNCYGRIELTFLKDPKRILIQLEGLINTYAIITPSGEFKNPMEKRYTKC